MKHIGNKARSRVRNWASLRNHQIKPATYPAVMDIEPTNICNLKCTMCPRTKLMTRPRGMMSRSLFEGLVDESRGLTEYMYVDMMGEPTLHTDLCEMIQYAEENEIRTSLSTNCVSMGESISRRLIGSGLSVLVISLDAATAGTYRKVRGGDFQRVLDNVRKLFSVRREVRSCRPIIILQFIRTMHNADEEKDFIELFTDLSPDMISIRDCHDWAGSMDKEDFAPKNGPQIAGRPRIGQPPPCRTLWNQVTVLWNGDVTVCCYDFDGRSVIGNLNENSMAEIWNSGRMIEYRREHLSGQFRNVECCQNCFPIPPHGLRTFLAGCLDSELLKVLRWYCQREGVKGFASRWSSFLESYRLLSRLELQ